MAGSGSIVAVLTFWLNSSDTNAREIEKQIDGKLDKTEFTTYKYDHEVKHQKEQEVNKEFRQWLKDEMKGLRQDVRELRKQK